MRAPAVPNATLQILREEHAALAAVLRSLSMMIERELDAVFGASRDPLAGGARDPAYDGQFSRIAMKAPAPIGVGSA